MMDLHNKAFEHCFNNKPQSLSENIKVLYRFRYTIAVLAWRELSLRYGNSRFRILWLFAKPALIACIYLFVLYYVLKIPTNIKTYSSVVLTGLLTWQPFIENIYSSGKALLIDKDMLKKSEFPRLAFPIYRTLLQLPEFIVILLIVLAYVYLVSSPVHLLLLIMLVPVILLLQLMLTLGVSLWLNVWYFESPEKHQLAYIFIPFLIWLTPVFYINEMMPGKLAYILYLNPLSGLININRYLLVNMPLTWADWFPSICLIVTIFISGFKAFVQREHYFAEKI